MSSVIGIDLGTSNSAVAAFFGGKHQVIPDDQGRRLCPSIVSFGKDKKILIGEDAKTQLFSNPKRTVSSIKRLIGRKIFSSEVQKAKVLMPYNLVEGPDQNVAVEIDGVQYLPQEISALILRHMKEIAEKKLERSIENAVVTVPAYFNDNQRQATADACKIAGLNALRMINEPTAAALAYGFGKGLNETVAVYDLGGGTFDISILRLKDKVFEVIATAGDTFLGGDDFDDRIIDLCAQTFLKQNDIDLRTIPQALPLLRQNAERAKRKLSYAEKTDIYIPGIVKFEEKTLDLHMSLSRQGFENACHDLIQRTFSVCDEALRLASIRAQDLDAIILVGGPTKMTVIQEAVTKYFGKDGLRDQNPDEVVAVGAAIQATALAGEQGASQSKSLLLDVTPLDLGIATVGGYIEPIIEANSPIPVQASKVFSTTKDHQKTVDIRIFQGKNRREEESTMLGEFEFSGIKDSKAGDVGIEVNFSINTDGIVEVSAKDQETGAAHSMKVKLAATMSPGTLRESTAKSKEHKRVQLKSEFKDYQKVVVCIPTKGGNVYEEGLLPQLDTAAPIFELTSESGLIKPKSVERAKVAWILNLADFSSTPRYIQALSEKPSKFFTPPKCQLYDFKLKDGSHVYAQASLPSMKDLGFWVEPYFSQDELPGKVFVYSQFVAEATPMNL